MTSWRSSSRVPIVEPTTSSCLKKTRARSAGGLMPLVAPATTIRPPGRSARSECAQVASPTVSITASTRSGRRAPDSKAAWAPHSSANSRLRSLAAGRPDPQAGGAGERDAGAGDAAARALDQDRLPGDQARAGEQHPVGGQPGGRQAGGLFEVERLRLGDQVVARHRDPLGEACRDGPRRGSCACGSSASSPRQPGSPTSAWTITSLPSASTPAASQPRIIGSRSAGRPTPFSDQRSWWLSAAARTSTSGPALRHVGLGHLAELERRERVLGVDPGGVGGEHGEGS